MRLVTDALDRAVASTPDKVVLVCDGQRLSYRRLDELANRLANTLAAHSVDRGDRVVLWGPNSVELVVGIFAVLKLGAVIVLANDSAKPTQLAYLVADCAAKAILATGRQSVAVVPLLDSQPTLQVGVVVRAAGPSPRLPHDRLLDYAEALARGDVNPPPRRAIDRDLACLIYTSGSTGAPKGVMSAHHNVVFAVDSITSYLRNTADDVVLSALPLSFDYGLYQLFMVVAFGGTLVLERSFAFPAEFLLRLAEERATGVPGVPTMWALLLGMDLTAFDLGSLRYVTNTAAALPASHIQQLRRALPGVDVYSMYGLTETKRTLYMPPAALDERPGSVGIAIPGTEVWLEDEQGNRLGSNQVGELVVRGGHVMLGYWNAPDATAARFRPGPQPGERVCHSGDLFTRDDAGFYTFVGRRDDMLKCRGEKVAPKEVEGVLHGLDGVREAAVVGVPDAVLGQAVVAHVVRRDATLTVDAVLRHCRARLEDFKVPRTVLFVDELPKTDNGKVHRAKLAGGSAERP